MSRGLGATQWRVLAVLADYLEQCAQEDPDGTGDKDGSLTMRELAEGDTAAPTRAAVESVRRACKRLADAGLVDLEFRRGTLPGRNDELTAAVTAEGVDYLRARVTRH